jgi:hypothetical protein
MASQEENTGVSMMYGTVKRKTTLYKGSYDESVSALRKSTLSSGQFLWPRFMVLS